MEIDLTNNILSDIQRLLDEYKVLCCNFVLFLVSLIY